MELAILLWAIFFSRRLLRFSRFLKPKRKILEVVCVFRSSRFCCAFQFITLSIHYLCMALFVKIDFRLLNFESPKKWCHLIEIAILLWAIFFSRRLLRFSRFLKPKRKILEVVCVFRSSRFCCAFQFITLSIHYLCMALFVKIDFRLLNFESPKKWCHLIEIAILLWAIFFSRRLLRFSQFLKPKRKIFEVVCVFRTSNFLCPSRYTIMMDDGWWIHGPWIHDHGSMIMDP